MVVGSLPGIVAAVLEGPVGMTVMTTMNLSDGWKLALRREATGEDGDEVDEVSLTQTVALIPLLIKHIGHRWRVE